MFLRASRKGICQRRVTENVTLHGQYLSLTLQINSTVLPHGGRDIAFVSKGYHGHYVEGL
jgi:hypothetical protein